MVTRDRIRLTGLLRKAPANAGVFYMLASRAKMGRRDGLPALPSRRVGKSTLMVRYQGGTAAGDGRFAEVDAADEGGDHLAAAFVGGDVVELVLPVEEANP